MYCGKYSALCVLYHLGKSWEEKVEAIRTKMREESCSALMVTALDECAC